MQPILHHSLDIIKADGGDRCPQRRADARGLPRADPVARGGRRRARRADRGLDPPLGAFNTLCLERAREEAVAAEAAYVGGADGSSPGRGAVRGQGSVRHGRGPDHLRIADVRRSRPGPGRRGGSARPRSRRDPGRQDPDARVRLGDHLGQRGDGDEPQPMGARAHLRRVERRLCRGARGRLRAAGAGKRHRGLDTGAVELLRNGRAQADLRPGQPRRHLPAGSARWTTPVR